jgi:small subunit ribosomal protein S2
MGHSTSLWNPRNSRYILGVRQGIHIISLETTLAYLKRACRVVEAVAERGGLILFVGTRKGQESAVIKAAELAKGCHIFERWIPGSLTNGQQILGNCKIMVVDELDREMPEYEDQLHDQAAIKPDLVVCLNPLENEVLLHECGIHNIPTIGVIDTDANPTWVTYPIPANDDSLRCIQVTAGVLGRAGQQGQERRLELAKSGRVLYERVGHLYEPTTVKAVPDIPQSASADTGDLISDIKTIQSATDDRFAAADEDEDDEDEDEGEDDEEFEDGEEDGEECDEDEEDEEFDEDEEYDEEEGERDGPRRHG